MRSLTASMQTAVAATVVRPVLIAAISVDGGTIRAWNGMGTLSWGGNDYTGIGSFGGVSAVQETEDLRANGITFRLSGVPSELLSAALGDVRQGLTAQLWLGMMDSAGALIADPYLLFAGLTDVPSIDEGGATATVTISAESRLVDLERARVRRYTNEDQQIDDSTDRGFEYVPSLQDAEIVWG